VTKMWPKYFNYCHYMTHDRGRGLLSLLFPVTDSPHFFTVQVVQYYATISSTAELLICLSSML